MNYKVELNYYSPANESMVTENGFRYVNMKSVIKGVEEIIGENDIDIFEQFYKMNNSLRYCNGSYYTFMDAKWKVRYEHWLKSEDFKHKSFNLYYGGGIVD